MTDTLDALRSRLAATSQRKLAAELNVPHWDIADALRDNLGRDRENRLRLALGLPPLPVTVTIDPATQRIVPRPVYRKRPKWNRLIV